VIGQSTRRKVSCTREVLHDDLPGEHLDEE
jgi:hypothetical protein